MKPCSHQTISSIIVSLFLASVVSGCGSHESSVGSAKLSNGIDDNGGNGGNGGSNDDGGNGGSNDDGGGKSGDGGTGGNDVNGGSGGSGGSNDDGGGKSGDGGNDECPQGTVPVTTCENPNTPQEACSTVCQGPGQNEPCPAGYEETTVCENVNTPQESCSITCAQSSPNCDPQNDPNCGGGGNGAP